MTTRRLCSMTIAILLTIGLLEGCQPELGTIPGLGDPVPAPFNDPEISILSPELQGWLGFQNATITDRGGLMDVQVPVRNLSTVQYVIDYRITFFDRTGRRLGSQMAWRREVLHPKQVGYMNATALSTDAVRYKVEIKWAK